MYEVKVIGTSKKLSGCFVQRNDVYGPYIEAHITVVDVIQVTSWTCYSECVTLYV